MKSYRVTFNNANEIVVIDYQSKDTIEEFTQQLNDEIALNIVPFTVDSCAIQSIEEIGEAE